MSEFEEKKNVKNLDFMNKKCVIICVKYKIFKKFYSRNNLRKKISKLTL